MLSKRCLLCAPAQVDEEKSNISQFGSGKWFWVIAIAQVAMVGETYGIPNGAYFVMLYFLTLLFSKLTSS
jgi:hypothetical protein